MKCKITISIIFFLNYFSSIGQTINLKGQLLQDTKVIKNYTVIIDGHPATTNDAGIFQAPISAATKQVKIQPSDQKYIIVYPQGGRVLVPKDASLVTEVVVAAFKSNDYLKEYLNVSKQIKDSVGKSTGQIKLLNGQLDSIIEVLHKLSYTDTDLHSAKEIQEGKDRNIFDITKDLEDYSRNAQNLLSAFKYVSDYAFSDSRALLQLSQAVTNYNQVYDRLDGKKIFYQKTIADYWGKDEADSFQHVISFAMDTIHASKIYPLRDLLKQINDYFNTNNKNNQLKLSIQKKIADAVAEDEILIERLKNEITVFSQSLTT